jgi:hypothetical protein
VKPAGLVAAIGGTCLFVKNLPRQRRRVERPAAAAAVAGADIRGAYTILKDWLQPQRESARTVEVRRFETPPGKQAQVDWGHLGTLMNGQQRTLSGFTFTLGIADDLAGRQNWPDEEKATSALSTDVYSEIAICVRKLTSSEP